MTESKKENLERIKSALLHIGDVKTITTKNVASVVEMVRGVSEIIVYGEQKKAEYFDIFCERNVMNSFVEFLPSDFPEVHIQILQTVGILVQNVSTVTQLYYILSHKAMNDIILYDYDFNNEEIVMQYISLLKSLAVRLDSTTLMFFFNEKYNRFPLFTRAILFYNHPERMVRTAVFTITLKVFKLRSKSLETLLTSMPSVLYFGKIACYLRDLWLLLDSKANDKKIQCYETLKGIVDDSLNLLLYIDDIMNHSPHLAPLMANVLLYYAVYPLLISTVCSSAKPVMGINTGLFLLRQVCSSITYKPFIEAIAQTIFLPFQSKNIIQLVEEYPINVPQYSYHWILPKALRASSLNEYIGLNYSHDMDYFWDSQASFLRPYAESYTKEKEEISLSDPEYKKKVEKVKATYREKMLNFLGKDREEVEEEHLRLSHAFGLPVGVAKDVTSIPISVLEQSRKNLDLLKAGKFPSADYVASVFSSNLFIFLTSKDDTLVLQVSGFLSLLYRLSIQPEILYFCNNIGLSPLGTRPKTTLAQMVLNLMNMDPPFRYITMDVLLTLLQQILLNDSRNLLPYEASLYKIAYVTAIKNMKEICKVDALQTEIFELFREEWTAFYAFTARRARKHEQIFSDAALLWGMQDDPKAVLSEYIRLPITEKDTAKSHLRTFMAMRQGYGKLFKVEESEVFPYPEDVKEPPTPAIVVLSESGKLINCQQPVDGEMIGRYIMEDEAHFVLVELDYTRLTTAKVIKKARIADVHVGLDPNEPRRLNFYLTKGLLKTKKQTTEELPLYFEDNTMCLYVKSHIDECRHKFLSRQFTKVIKYLNSCETKMKYTITPYDNSK